MDSLLRHPRLIPALVVLVCLAALGSAFASEIFGGLKPCVLCIYQRWAYAAALAAGGFGLLFGARMVLLRLSVGLSGLAFLVGAGIATFHSGVERKWWQGTAACHAPEIDPGASIDEMKELLLNQAFVPCDKIPWSLFGASMANYNVLVSLGLAAFFLIVAVQLGKVRSA